MTNFDITIISDPVCPWCYIGKKRLDSAIALYQKVYPNARRDTFTVTWRAYYLDPTAPKRGISWEERALQKLVATRGASTTDSNPNPDSDRQAVGQLRERLARIGRQAGIEFSFAGKIGNTRSAHRAIALSKTLSSSDSDSPADSQNRFVAALFAAYFEGTADITSHEALADVAAGAGLDGARMLAWLGGEGDEGGAEVDAEDRAARDAGLRGVPSFAVQGRRVDGAQDVQDFLDLFIKIKEEEGGQEQVQE
ncbi:thioredoxin-like protein [Nemania sp. NC0429]|nr:thioredoxin-like protein [Nemania sp. NC0429]